MATLATETATRHTRVNGTRHILCSQLPFTSDELRTEGDEEQFDLLHADLREEHQPKGPTEEILVFKMAEHFWFGQRASWLLAKHLSQNEDSTEVDNNGNFKDNVKQVSLMLRYHTTADRAFSRNLELLRKLQKDRQLREIGFVPQNPKRVPCEQPCLPKQIATKPPSSTAIRPPERPPQSPLVLPSRVLGKPDIRKSLQDFFQSPFRRAA